MFNKINRKTNSIRIEKTAPKNKTAISRRYTKKQNTLNQIIEISVDVKVFRKRIDPMRKNEAVVLFDFIC